MSKFDESGLTAPSAGQTVQAGEVELERQMAAIRASYDSFVSVHKNQLKRVQEQCRDTNAKLDAALLQASEALQTRDAVLSSTTWRSTALIRRLLAVTPFDLRRLGRRFLKAALWAATPWKTPARLRFLRDRNLLVAQQRASLVSDYVGKGAPPQAPPVLSADADDYERWIYTYESQELAPTTELLTGLNHDDVAFSFILSGFELSGAFEATLASLDAQPGLDWELLVASSESRPLTAEGKVRVVWARCEPDADRGVVLADLLAKAQGHWIAVLDAGDRLAVDALAYVRQAIVQSPSAVVIYSDEDEAGRDHHRHSPQFKPCWSPELLQAYNYFGRLTFIARMWPCAPVVSLATTAPPPNGD